ncbi:hypothetical protein OUZ56_000213 [Daphnia magna]|uniref:Uncharacterized protein n=1 Tax=Daphnia magna TaxID=35525 RepID=A0ABQ9ZZ52_9CRUS|nr:hypothetical protein OUZ56_000213 [Daphnia magna]
MDIKRLSTRKQMETAVWAKKNGEGTITGGLNPLNYELLLAAARPSGRFNYSILLGGRSNFHRILALLKCHGCISTQGTPLGIINK